MVPKEWPENEQTKSPKDPWLLCIFLYPGEALSMRELVTIRGSGLLGRQDQWVSPQCGAHVQLYSYQGQTQWQGSLSPEVNSCVITAQDGDATGGAGAGKPLT